jgi:Na+/proline symporter
MSPLSVIITIAAYFAILFTVSYIAGRKADNAGFFVGNRKSSWYVVAFAMIGSSISGVTYVSVPGMVAASNFGYLQMVLGFIAGQLIIAFVLTPLFYRMNLVSIYEYLENRFGMSSYRTGAWFFFISKMLGAAVRLFLVCLTLQLLVFEPFGLPFILNVAITVALVWLYTFRGGVKSLIWTDSLKTFCLVVSVVLCICYIASDLNLSFTGMLYKLTSSKEIPHFKPRGKMLYFAKEELDKWLKQNYEPTAEEAARMANEAAAAQPFFNQRRYGKRKKN